MGRPDKASFRLLFAETKDLLSSQLSTFERLDEKASGLASLNAVILGLVVAGYADQGVVLQSGGRGVAAVASGSTLLLGSIVIALLAYHPKDYATGISARSIEASLAYDVTETAFFEQAIKTYHQGLDENNKKLRAKGLFVQASMWLLFPGIVLALLGTASLILTA